jgi:hypothetical protein
LVARERALRGGLRRSRRRGKLKDSILGSRRCTGGVLIDISNDETIHHAVCAAAVPCHRDYEDFDLLGRLSLKPKTADYLVAVKAMRLPPII